MLGAQREVHAWRHGKGRPGGRDTLSFCVSDGTFCHGKFPAASAVYGASLPCYTPLVEAEGSLREMKAVKYTKDGVVISSSWVKGWGKPVVAHRGSQILILESPARAASRKRLTRMVSKLRYATRKLGPLTPEQITAEVAAVRRERGRIVVLPLPASHDPIRKLGRRPVRCGLRNGAAEHDAYLYDTP